MAPKTDVDRVIECKAVLENSENSNEDKLKEIMENDEIKEMFTQMLMKAKVSNVLGV